MNKLFLLLIFIQIIQIHQILTVESGNEYYFWCLKDVLNPPDSYVYFGICVDRYQEFIAIGTYNSNQIFIYKLNETNWDLYQTLKGEQSSSFGINFVFSGSYLIVGASGFGQVLIYKFNGSFWNLHQFFQGEIASQFGSSISTSGNILVIGSPNSNQVYIYQFNESYWNINQVLHPTPQSEFGASVSNFGNITVVGSPGSDEVLIFSLNEGYWNLSQILTGEQYSKFGINVSITDNFIGISCENSTNAYVYSFDGNYWNLNETFNSDPYAIYQIKISQNLLIISSRFSELGGFFEYNGTDWVPFQLYREPNSSFFGLTFSVHDDSILVGDLATNQVHILTFNGSYWNLNQSINGSQRTDFGWNVAISDNFIAVGADQTSEVFTYGYNGSDWIINQTLQNEPESYMGSRNVFLNDTLVIGNSGNSNQVFIYQFNGTYWDLYQILYEPNISSYGNSVSISQGFIFVGASTESKVFIYEFNGTYWEMIDCLAQNGNFGKYIEALEDYVAVGNPDNNSIYVEKYNGSDWIEYQILSPGNGAGFGNSITISTDFIVSSNSQGIVYIYQSNGSYWNFFQLINKTSISYFGSSLSISGNVLVINAFSESIVFIYSFNQTYWNFNDTLSGSALTGAYGYSVSTYDNFIVVGNPIFSQAFVYELGFLSQVNLLNCSGLFSGFVCYWEKVNYPTTLKYQINYDSNWINIEIEQIEETENVFYSIFDYSSDSNIIGNQNYSVQIKACDLFFDSCGEPSFLANVTTKIGSVTNLNSYLSQNSSFLFIHWDFPNVEIIGGIPNLDHFVISYHNQLNSTPTNISINKVTTYFFFQDLDCGCSYSFSIWACSTPLCEGNDKGESIETFSVIPFDSVSNVACEVIQNTLSIDCTWDSPSKCPLTPNYYNFTYYSISGDDSGSFQTQFNEKIFPVQFGNQNYIIQISACDSNNVCGSSSTKNIIPQNINANNSSSSSLFAISVIFLIFGFSFLSVAFCLVNKRAHC
ncbi:hypothetical protein M0811_06175 [Anaeramoeba ignava]|uniref:Fibronectin type-III domain-containing protein n=1 Tax=Anaeramoeba ignava TaxID=1746090 RepID=A0A9Q0LSR1_ANAIG|nr:hypothetical protein M0811_06175 [Anaeramoeba ignava]